MKSLFRIILALALLAISPAAWGEAAPVKVTAVSCTTSSPKGTCAYRITYPRLSGLADRALEDRLNTMLKKAFMPAHMKSDEECARDAGARVTAETTFKTGIITDSLVSIAMKTVTSVPRARPGRDYREFTIDLRTGHVYGFSELFRPDSNYRKRIEEIVIRDATFQRDGDLPSDPPVEVHGRDFASLDYYLTQKSLVIVNLFDENVMADWVVSIPYEKIADILDPRGPLGSHARQ